MFVRTTNVYVYCGKYSLLIRRSATDEQLPLFWESPGGHTDILTPIHNLKLVRAEAARELEEETGIRVRPQQLKPMFFTGTHASFRLDLSSLPRIELSSEHDRFSWIDPLDNTSHPTRLRPEVKRYFKRLRP